MQSVQHSPAEERFRRQEGLVGSDVHEAISRSSIFIPGLGAIGSAALTALARTGVGRFVLVDDDEIGYQNFSSQLFASNETVSRHKAQTARRFVHSIHPECLIEVMPVTCDVDRLAEMIASVDVVVLGMDTLSGGIACCRAARIAARPVVDFLYFPTANVLSTLPGWSVPEERFGYPTRGISPSGCDEPGIAAESLLRVVAYGFCANPGLLEVLGVRHRKALGRFLRMEGPIPSFAPMTMQVGAMMAGQAVSLIAHSKGLPHLPLAWPGFYIDHYRLCSAIPEREALSEMPGHEAMLEVLARLRDSGGGS